MDHLREHDQRGIGFDSVHGLSPIARVRLKIEIVVIVHRAAGKPDRVVFLCCEGCSDDFKADPAKFLKKVDEAAAKKAKK